MARISRREALTRMLTGGAALLAHGGCPRSGTLVESFGPVELARDLAAAPQDEFYEVAARAISRGAAPDDLLGAAFVAGIEEIRPHGPGGKFHAVLMIESAFQLAEVCSPRDAYLVALWALWDFKRCQQRDVQEEGDWTLPPAPDVRYPDAVAARRELAAAMESWDVERADRAVVGLLRELDREALFELLWEHGARCYADFGHKVLHCVHAERTLRRLDPRQVEPTLRSVVRGLLYTGDDGRRTEAYASAVDLLPEFEGFDANVREDPQGSLELLKGLRGRPADEAQRTVVEAVAAGIGPQTVWDGLRLHAVEVFHRRGESSLRRHLPVHPVTEMSAFRHMWRTTASERVRKLALLQAAAWPAALREDMRRRAGQRDEPGLETLGDAETGAMPSMEDLFEEPSAARARARIDHDTDGAAAYLAELRRHLIRGAFQDHQVKFVAVLHEEAAAVHPRWRSRLLAPAITYVPTAADPETEVHARSVDALRRAGVG